MGAAVGMVGSEPEDRVLRMLLAEELRISNKHLPTRREPLSKLLAMEYPHVVLRDGTVHFFRKRELRELAEIAGEDADKLLLPIVVVLRSDMGEGTAVVEDEVAARVIAKVLGLEYRGGVLHLYRPHLAELREKFDTVIQFAIFVRLEDLEAKT